MKKVLVTGGAGFIGSHLVDKLLALGFEVIVIDDLSVGRRENLAAHSKNPRLHLHVLDVANQDAIRPRFEGVEWVFHLAARADIVPSIQLPMIYHRANVDGTAAVLEACRLQGVKRLIYAASSSCYGIPDEYPTPETAPIQPRYPYALTKWIGEQMVMHWEKVYKIPTLSLRFFNVFGPRARTSGTYGAVLGVFLAQKRNGKPLTVVGDGSQTRDFTYVTDVVEALLCAAESGLSGEIFNVGSGGTYSVNSLVELIGGPTVSLPKRPGEPDCTFADITRIRERLGWEPTVKFEAGVRELLGQIDLWENAPVWTPESIQNATKDWFKYLS